MPLAADFSALLRPISKAQPAGESVRYDPIFDQIKQCRVNEDEALSQGVWEAPLVKADWEQVSQLCQQVLAQRSKDLQVAAWLVDSWAHLHGLDGMHTGVRFITAFSAAFWGNLHPCDEDHEPRLMIYEWLRKALLDQLHSYPLALSHRGQPINLLAVQNAERLQEAVARSKNPSKLQELAKSRDELFKNDIDAYIKVLPHTQMEQHISDMQQLKRDIRELSSLLDEKLPDNTLSFTQIYSALDSLARLLVNQTLDEAEIKPTKQEKPQVKVEQAAPKNDVKPEACDTRTAAYAAIRQALEYLQEVEPHSPTPHVLKKVLQWEKQSLAEIFAGFGNNPQDFVTIANFIGLAVNKENTAPSTSAQTGPK